MSPTAQAGLSHLLEHLLFKGTARYASLEIDQIFDAMGAELNAGTGKETTSVYARVIDEHLADAFDVMADMVFRPTLSEIDSEREVILEEIAMYEDDPQEKVFDILGEAMFGVRPARPGDHRPRRGHLRNSRRRDRRLSRRALPTAQRRDRGRGCGRARRVRRARRRAAVGPHARARPRDGQLRPASLTPARAPHFERKDTEQYHVCLGAVGLSRHDDRRFALRVLDTIFGGTSSSRLFQEVREERGLAYAVYSFTSGLPRHRAGRPVRRHPRRQPRAGDGGGRHRARSACASSRPARTSCGAPRRTSRAGSCSRWSRPARV